MTISTSPATREDSSDSFPRLTRMWGHLSRQHGGIGTRGPGETQLEVDRRRVREKIAFLKGKLEQVDRERKVQRARRKGLHRTGLVGYTNAGKSTLMNALTGAEILTEDKLFATLDAITRRYRFPTGETTLLTDTVGFIRKLPHHLIASFRSTRDAGVEYLQVKTLGPSRPDDNYAATRAFYESVGFRPLEETSLWGDVNPCLFMVKKL